MFSVKLIFERIKVDIVFILMILDYVVVSTFFACFRTLICDFFRMFVRNALCFFFFFFNRADGFFFRTTRAD